MRRREFLGILGGAAVWPAASKAQQAESVRLVGVLTSSDQMIRRPKHEWQCSSNSSAVRVDCRPRSEDRNPTDWGDLDSIRRYAAELVALSPDVIFSVGGLPTTSLQQATRTIPIVFMNVADPVGAGFVETWPTRAAIPPVSSTTEYSIGGKWASRSSKSRPM